MAFDVERKWAHDLAISYDNATRIKEDMAKLSDIKRWQKWADEYDLPLSLMGYIFKHTSKGGPINGECVKSFERFLCDNYSCRIEDAKKKKENQLHFLEYMWIDSIYKDNKNLQKQVFLFPLIELLIQKKY